MAHKYHIIYLVIIALLGLFAIFSIALGFKTAEQRVMPPSKSFSFQTLAGHRYANFSGTWKIEGEKSFPKHAYQYECTDETMTCTASDAWIHDNYLAFDTNQLEITKWTDREITIKDDALCRSNTILVDTLTEKIVMISKDIPNRNEQICKGLDVLTQPRRSELVSGIDELYGKK